MGCVSTKKKAMPADIMINKIHWPPKATSTALTHLVWIIYSTAHPPTPAPCLT